MDGRGRKARPSRWLGRLKALPKGPEGVGGSREVARPSQWAGKGWESSQEVWKDWEALQ